MVRGFVWYVICGLQYVGHVPVGSGKQSCELGAKDFRELRYLDMDSSSCCGWRARGCLGGSP